MTETKYYKVVRIYNGLPHSITGKYHELAHRGRNLTYEINKTTYPVMPLSKLFVFDDLQAAKEFAYMFSYDTIAIFEAEVTCPNYVTYISAYAGHNKQFWEDLANKRDTDCRLDHPPDHTVVVDSVKLVKQLYSHVGCNG